MSKVLLVDIDTMEKPVPDQMPILAECARAFAVPRNMLSLHSGKQLWENTACGHNRIGGRAMTWATTYVIVADKTSKIGRVYFNGEFAYKVDTSDERFWELFEGGKLPNVVYAENYPFWVR